MVNDYYSLSYKHHRWYIMVQNLTKSVKSSVEVSLQWYSLTLKGINCVRMLVSLKSVGDSTSAELLNHALS